MSDFKGNVICIIGMHRSGTSMIAGAAPTAYTSAPTTNF
jgi:hypothetical protein